MFYDETRSWELLLFAFTLQAGLFMKMGGGWRGVTLSPFICQLWDLFLV